MKTELDCLVVRQRQDERLTGQAGTQEIAIRCKEKYFALRVVKHWNRLPEVAVAFLSLEIFKTQPHKGLNNVV